MPTYKTPGVYVEEISTLPPSVAEVSTAIPAFIGYTEKIPEGAESQEITGISKPIRLNTFLEFKTLFGGAPKASFEVKMEGLVGSENINLKSVSQKNAITDSPKYLLYYALSLYFANGGGTCYIVSAGTYDNNGSISKTKLEDALSLVEKEDEPTLLVVPDAVNLSDADRISSLYNRMLTQCHDLKDRFAIFDINDADTDGSIFREKIRTEPSYLKYGAAYIPNLQTLIPIEYRESDVSITLTWMSKTWSHRLPADGTNTKNLMVAYNSGNATDLPRVEVVSSGDAISFEVKANNTFSINLGGVDRSNSDIVDAWTSWKAVDGNDPQGFDLSKQGSIPITGTSAAALSPGADQTSSTETFNLDTIRDNKTAIYNQVVQGLSNQRKTLPPSAAIAGIYARVDRERGVWKAPANVSVLSIVGPTRNITAAEQENLNIDANSGKSINAIRNFTGKGTLVWGGRTLAGNDNEWRYVSVRRLFNLIEESIQKSTAFAVFEPNDSSTWLRVKAMIDSYLFGLWQQGALTGSTAEQAYFVNVGLGKSMTPQDILEGRMIVEVGIAAVRPAEFIVLRFSHKLAEA